MPRVTGHRHNGWTEQSRAFTRFLTWLTVCMVVPSTHIGNTRVRMGLCRLGCQGL